MAANHEIGPSPPAASPSDIVPMRAPGGAGGVGLFLRRFLRSPRVVGSVSPSSRHLARRMVEPVRFDVDGGIRIVEFGPGTGPFTAAILQRLPADGSYVGIERDPDFVTHLRRRFPAAAFHLASAEEVGPILAAAGLAAADHIVSGLPFASLPRETTRRILDAVQAALAPGGTFTTFQYVHAVGLPPARAFREEMRRRFGEHRPARLVVRNLPPAFVLTWDKARSGV